MGRAAVRSSLCAPRGTLLPRGGREGGAGGHPGDGEAPQAGVVQARERARAGGSDAELLGGRESKAPPGRDVLGGRVQLGPRGDQAPAQDTASPRRSMDIIQRALQSGAALTAAKRGGRPEVAQGSV